MDAACRHESVESLHASHAKAEGPEGSAGRRITAVSAYGYCNTTDYDESRNEITRRQEAYLLLSLST